MKAKDLITIDDFSREDISVIFGLTAKLKAGGKSSSGEPLKGKTLGLIFQKPSLRTKVSFVAAMAQLGGTGIYLAPGEIRLGEREEIKDVARTLSRYLDGIVARTFRHGDILELARYSSIPVINGLSDFSHPCQALTDLFTVSEKKGRLKGLKLAYIGDGNNVCNSLLYICAKMGVNMAVAAPKGYGPDKKVAEAAAKTAAASGSRIELTSDPSKAVAGADVIYTDVWTSMGQEKEKAKRMKAFKGFQVNAKLCSKADRGHIIMHCLPAHRGEEITEECMEGPHSVVFDQAENRLHVEKALLLLLLK
ncbi:MAG TPA: ornithine carbamoyltransferase [Candidatus Omnitrophota bacterium]|nr:ornithine carbamoyltransferase [Candidatus Omnitrophota bacterium]HOX09884.1 ornithine carbamoyltransferase [Candidatus Omnitrophota bacterium]HRZ66595.1 ornithine carbamoyltransferase [Candidatus Omnitrophota bacterium]